MNEDVGGRAQQIFSEAKIVEERKKKSGKEALNMGTALPRPKGTGSLISEEMAQETLSRPGLRRWNIDIQPQAASEPGDRDTGVAGTEGPETDTGWAKKVGLKPKA